MEKNQTFHTSPKEWGLGSGKDRVMWKDRHYSFIDRVNPNPLNTEQNIPSHHHHSLIITVISVVQSRQTIVWVCGIIPEEFCESPFVSVRVTLNVLAPGRVHGHMLTVTPRLCPQHFLLGGSVVASHDSISVTTLFRNHHIQEMQHVQI